MNAHLHTLSEGEIRYCKEQLSYLHNKNLRPDQNEKIINIYKYYDSNNDVILRNY